MNSNVFMDTAYNNILKHAFKHRLSRKDLLSFTIKYLDDSLIGIFPGDLILLGAPTGLGKTQLCAAIALDNVMLGKKVVYFPLEAEQYEIENRILYRTFCRFYFDDDERDKSVKNISYLKWRLGEHDDIFKKYNESVMFVSEKLKNLVTIYKKEDFTVETLLSFSKQFKVKKPDLIMIDHAHYFDYDSDNENKALKQIMVACRSLTQLYGIPIILVAQLRKTNRAEREICPPIEQFHGSSDLTKIATRVITMNQGELLDGSLKETFFRICKDRLGSGATAYCGKQYYNLKNQSYETNYRVGKLTGGGTDWEEVEKLPEWATIPTVTLGMRTFGF